MGMGPGAPGVAAARSMAGGDLTARRARYQQLDRAAALEVDPQRKAALLDARDAVLSDPSFTAMNLFSDEANPPPDAVSPVAASPEPELEPEPVGPAAAPSTIDAPVPMPDFPTFLAMSGGGGRAGNPAMARDAAAESAAARQQRARGYDLRSEGVQQQADVQGYAGRQQANVLGDAARQLVEAEQQHQAERDAVNQRVAQAEADRKRLDAEFDAERARQGQSVEETWSSGRRIMAAIAMAMGAFGAGINGGRNQAADIINTSIDREIAQRRDRLRATGEARDAADRHYQSLVQRLGSVDAADAASKAHLLNVAKVKVDELAARAQGEESQAAAMETKGALEVEEAKARQAEAAAVAKAAQGSGRSVNAASALMDYIKLAKDWKELTGAGIEQADPMMVKEISVQLQRNGVPALEEGLASFNANPTEVPGLLDKVMTAGWNPARIVVANDAEREKVGALLNLLASYNRAKNGGHASNQDAERAAAALGWGPFTTSKEIEGGVARMTRELKAIKANIYSLNEPAARQYERNIAGERGRAGLNEPAGGVAPPPGGRLRGGP